MYCTKCLHKKGDHKLIGVWVDARSVLFECQVKDCKCMPSIEAKRVPMPEALCIKARKR